jgi:hypothetical protein
MRDEYESFGVAEATVAGEGAALVKMAASSRKRGRAKAKAPTTPQRSAAGTVPVVVGLVTRSMRRIADGVQSISGVGPWGWAAGVACLALLGLCGLAWQRAPQRLAPKALTMVNLTGERVPSALVDRLYRAYPRHGELGQPDPALLRDFAAHLATQNAIAAVDGVDVCYEVDHAGQARQVLFARVAVREPLLAVQVAPGRVQAVDAEGIFLPEFLVAPSGHPQVFGLQAAGRPALDELLALWPLLSTRVDPASIASIDLAGDLRRRAQRGLVLHMRNGVTVLWGMPGEARYGVDHQLQVEQLAHALQCQGAAGSDAVIDVRFDQARYVSAL